MEIVLKEQIKLFLTYVRDCLKLPQYFIYYYLITLLLADRPDLS